MKIIQLTQGKSTAVSDEDFDFLDQFKWCAKKCGGNKFYAVRRGSNRMMLYMHKVILDLPSGSEGDHINGDSLDNQRGNLRPATRLQNLRNRKKFKTNTSGFTGVCFYKNRINLPWNARIQIHGKFIHLGFFASAIEAAKIRNRAAKKFFGKYVFAG
jgi:hypothetical protein